MLSPPLPYFGCVSDESAAIRAQLRYMLAQLLRANSFEFSSLVALMLQDRTGLLHAISLALNDAITADTNTRLETAAVRVGGSSSSLERTFSGAGMQSHRDSPDGSFNRVINGLYQVAGWARQHCPVYAEFVRLMEPEFE